MAGLIAQGKIAPRPESAPAPDSANSSAQSVTADPDTFPGTCPYDLAVRSRQITYGEARLREEVMAKIIENEGLRDENAIRRGHLYTREQIKERDERIGEVVLGKLGSVADMVAALVDPDKRDYARATVKGWIAVTRSQMADALKGVK